MATVDHTGIDIIAYDPRTKKRLGITVKSRTRLPKTENESVNIFSYQNGKNDRHKMVSACEAFGCEPWIGVYVESISEADLFLTSLTNYDSKYRRPGKTIDDWKMGAKYLEKYIKDREIRHIHISFERLSWW